MQRVEKHIPVARASVLISRSACMALEEDTSSGARDARKINGRCVFRKNALERVMAATVGYQPKSAKGLRLDQHILLTR